MRGEKRKVWSWRDDNDLRKQGIREKRRIRRERRERDSGGAREYITVCSTVSLGGGGGVDALHNPITSRLYRCFLPQSSFL